MISTHSIGIIQELEWGKGEWKTGRMCFTLQEIKLMNSGTLNKINMKYQISISNKMVSKTIFYQWKFKWTQILKR